MVERTLGYDGETSFSLLSDRRIMDHIEAGNIIIDPFNRENLGTASYDVTLGEWYFRESRPEPGKVIYSPWSEADVKMVWGEPQKAVIAGGYFSGLGIQLPEGIFDSDQIICIPPGETYLCHTQEFIGGRNVVTTMMKARSSLGRNFIEICKCAGWGDVGYVNRWTMEITNNSQNFVIPLVVGRRVAQIAFFEVGKTLGQDYSFSGKYQTSTALEELRANWSPSEMIPKMWRDRELKK